MNIEAIKSWPIFRWPLAPVVMVFLVVGHFTYSRNPVVAVSVPVPLNDNKTTSDPQQTDVNLRTDFIGSDSSDDESERHWGRTDQVRIDRGEDSGYYTFARSVPGGCLYQISNSNSADEAGVVGGIAFAPFPCAPDSGRAPEKSEKEPEAEPK